MKFVITILMLVCSNAFMTFAWYGHLSTLKGKCWFVAALLSWGVAFFEYMIQVPANRIGSEVMTLPQLKIIQEAISLSVFVPFAIFFSKQRVGWNYLGAAVCVACAVLFIFMGNNDATNASDSNSIRDASTKLEQLTDEN